MEIQTLILEKNCQINVPTSFINIVEGIKIKGDDLQGQESSGVILRLGEFT